MRRIDAARLLCDIPQVTEKIKQGTITISQTTQIQRALRDYKKIKKEPLSKSEKHALFTKIENTNQKETEKIIATTLGLPITTIQKQQLHRDSSVTLTLTFTAEQFELLEKAQNMISHAVPNRQWADTLTYLAQKEVTRRSTHKSSKNSTPVASVEKTTMNTKIESRRTRYIPASIRKTMLDANATCMFKNKDGGTCKNKRFLQIDHIQSWSSGGSNTLDNLQVLCGTHNRFKYSKSQN